MSGKAPLPHFHFASNDPQQKFQVEAFLLEHLRFQKLTDSDFFKISQEKIVPDPRGVHLATFYTRALINAASILVGHVANVVTLIPLFSSFDGIHFQQIYNRCKSRKSVDQEASAEELAILRPYFDIVTSGGRDVKW